jgi:anhydro-N-acetylmuramic acid kinase
MALYIGLISGTSMDAIDAALVDFDAEPLRVLATSATAFDPALKTRVAAMIDRADSVALDEVGQIDVEVGRAFAQATLSLLRTSGTSAGEIRAIGSHGQTLRHRPDLPAAFTWQIGDPNVLAEMTGISVVADFRRRDVAAGGQGAPLLPVFHDQVFRSRQEDRVIANLGGIANVTLLLRSEAGTSIPVLGFDTGPANRLLDAWISLHQGREFDADGRWAATGSVDEALLEAFLDEPYLRLAPPKSTGRELFNMNWLNAKLASSARRPNDVQATLQRFTAVSLADAVRRCAPGAAIYVCGGGAHNHGLLAALAELLAPNHVATTAELGLDPDFVEAIAFAWFAKRTLEGLPSNAASVTGAKGARILGGVYASA